MTLLLAAWLMAQQVVLDNEYVRVTRDSAPCAAAPAPECGERVIVALGPIELRSEGGSRRLERGDIAVFRAGEPHSPPSGGPFLEVSLKPDRPPAPAPREVIPAEKNSLLHEGDAFSVFEEQLQPGDSRARHSHGARVVIALNRSRMQQLPDGEPQRVVDTDPDTVRFSLPLIHAVKNVGDTPLRNISIELRAGPR